MGYAIDMQSIASMVEGTAGGIKGLWGLFTANKAKKEKEALWANYPKMPIFKEYESALKTYQGLAGGGMPGYNLALGNIDQTTGQAMSEAKEGAISSTQYQDTVAKINQQGLKAKADLDFKAAQSQTEMAKAFAEASGKMGDLKVQQWAQNVNRPWNLQMNEALSKYQEGMSSAWGGLDTFVQSGFDFAESYEANPTNKGGFG